jgi:hypothetical protein
MKNISFGYSSELVLLLLLCLYSPLLELGRFFSLLILYTAGRTSWMGDQLVARRLPTQAHTTPTSMALVGFEPTVLVRAKTVHDFDRAVTVLDFRSEHSARN